MTIAQAIEILEDHKQSVRLPPNLDFNDAFALSIEALKRVLDVRRFPDASNWKLLPGETEILITLPATLRIKRG